jgi:transcriptional regulator with XRE-family HTH domain
VAKRQRNLDGFGDRLVDLREAAGLTQLELADLTGLSRVQINRYERGQSEPGWSIVCRIADVLEISVGEFRRSATAGCGLPLTPQR